MERKEILQRASSDAEQFRVGGVQFIDSIMIKNVPEENIIKAMRWSISDRLAEQLMEKINKIKPTKTIYGIELRVDLVVFTLDELRTYVESILSTAGEA